jgi:hypothetical protein
LNAKDGYAKALSLFDAYLQPLGMVTPRGPLRAMAELTRGIVFTSSVQLSNAARLLVDSPRPLRRAVDRLSDHLSDTTWDHREWAAAVLQQLADAVEEDDLIPIDGTELAKPYARRMQYVCTVKDASRVDDPLVRGYWCFGAYHWKPSSHALAEALPSLSPLMLRPWSTRQPGFLSENDLIGRWFWTLHQATAGRGIWLIDRGADRPEILSSLVQVQKRWIVRLREDRPLIGPDGALGSAGTWAAWALANRSVRGNAVTLEVSLPPDQVRQYGTPPKLHLVIPTYTFIRNGKEERWILLTCGLIGHQVGPRQTRYDYALRWRAEDAKRFLGQIWHIERFLTRSFLALERLLWCVCLAGGFIAMLQREERQWCEELRSHVLYHRKKDRVPCYRLARGLQAVAVEGVAMPMLNNA